MTFRNLTLEHSEMNNGTLEDLFLRELQEAYAAERLILGSLAMPAHALKGVDTFLDRYVTSTRERVRHLEQIFALAGCTPDESSRSPMAGMIAEISGLAAIADPEVQETVRTSLQVVQHYLVAQYAMLASWARLLQEQEPIAAALKEIHASLLPPQVGPSGWREVEPSKGASMGERLTALFDRKR